MKTVFLIPMIFIAVHGVSQDTQRRTTVVDTNLSAQYDVSVESPFCDLKKNIYCMLEGKISILRKGTKEVVQTIEAPVRIAPTLDHMIRFHDMNMDGEPDLLLKDIFLESSVYLFNVTKGQFELHQGLTSIVTGSKGFFTNKDFLVEVRLEPDYYAQHTRYYRLLDNQPTLVEERISTFPVDPLKDDYHVIKRKLEGTTWKENVSRVNEATRPVVPFGPGGKTEEVKETIAISAGPARYDVSIELPAARAKGKKSAVSESFYSYLTDKPAVIVITDRGSNTTQKILTKGVTMWLYDADRAADGKFSWLYPDQKWVRFEDVNFDGNDDLLVLRKTDGTSDRYSCYLYSITDKSFVYSADFSGLFDHWNGLESPEAPFRYKIDPGSRVITISFGDEHEFEERTYTVVDNTPRISSFKKLAGRKWLKATLRDGLWERRISVGE